MIELEHTNGAAHAEGFSNGASSVGGTYSTALLSDFARSDLDANDLVSMLIEELTGAQCKELGAQWRPGYKIPNLDLDGKPTGRFKIRYLDTRASGFKAADDGTAKAKKPPRYWAPKKHTA